MGIIYFVRADIVGLIKIGFTDGSLRERLASLYTFSPVSLVCLATVEGSLEDEASLHVRFRDDWHHGEWFRPSESLLKYINHYGSPYVDIVGQRRKRRGMPSATILYCNGRFREDLVEHARARCVGLATVIDEGLKRWAMRVGFDPPPFLPPESRSLRSRAKIDSGSVSVKAPPEWRGWVNRFADNFGVDVNKTMRTAARIAMGQSEPPATRTELRRSIRAC